MNFWQTFIFLPPEVFLLGQNWKILLFIYLHIVNKTNIYMYTVGVPHHHLCFFQSLLIFFGTVRYSKSQSFVHTLGQ